MAREGRKKEILIVQQGCHN